ncbi:hypothetical protein F7R20_06950 [Pseudomonas brassicacearum subsp. brassicacearum]|nr:hypothetical protein F7R20_06950 [Pseudomonas brassicacearum subsp. brassicacearum]QEO81752.1 hypothetical protein ELZ14_30980 [Pseudomonas brassicacearum]
MGASLLAMAIDQPILMLTDTPLSRASSLPQGFCSISTVRSEADRHSLEPHPWMGDPVLGADQFQFIAGANLGFQ